METTKNKKLTTTLHQLIWRTAKFRPTRQMIFLLSRLSRLRELEILFPDHAFWAETKQKLHSGAEAVWCLLYAEEEIFSELRWLILTHLSGFDETTVAPGEEGWPVAPNERRKPLSLSGAQSRTFKKLFGVSWKTFRDLPFKEQRERVKKYIKENAQ